MPPRNRFEKDYYGILQVEPGCAAEEVRKSYRRLALEWHPDRNPGNPAATEKFKEISEAYGVLIDPVKREQYDLARTPEGDGAFQYSRDDILRDLFRNQGASAIFEELAREFERRGMRVDRHYFQRTLSGGTVITGGVFIIGPFTPLIGLFKLARAALTGIGHASRALLGMAAGRMLPSTGDVVVPLRLTASEAARGTEKKIEVRLNGKDRSLLVKVPPGVRSGTRLRLRTPEQPVYIALEIH